MKAKIYTKTGDKGKTALVGGSRVDKTDPRLDAYGTLDELNSVLGLVRAHLTAVRTGEFGRQVESALQAVQNNLFNMGSHLACADENLRKSLPNLHPGAVAALEGHMDGWEAELPPLSDFILPGGSPLAAFAHLARTVCRRAEREVLRSEAADAEHIVYLNRLSDWLFVLARKFNQELGQSDVLWQKG